MKIRKIISSLMIILLLILFAKTESKATNEEISTEVKLRPTIGTIEENVEIPIEIYIKNDNYKISCIDVLIEFNDEIFYELEEDDFIPNVDMFVFQYDKEYKNLQIILDESINEGVIATIKVTPKKTIKKEEEDPKTELIKMYDMYLVTEESYEEVIPELESSIWTLGDEIELPSEPEQPDNPEQPEQPEKPENPEQPTDKLYLSSEIYKIGDNDINNYEEGDKYISRIEIETTKAEFINSLETNGTIKILKEDGTELGEEEFVGTGMTLEVTKGEEKISIKIVVIGDLSGDGKVTATDLSTLNQTILKMITLENEYHIAADLDENDKITATDLSTENKMFLKVL